MLSKLATPERKAFSVLKLSKSVFAILVQRAFRLKFNWDPPCGKNIRRWYRQFETTGCVSKAVMPDWGIILIFWNFLFKEKGNFGIREILRFCPMGCNI